MEASPTQLVPLTTHLLVTAVTLDIDYRVEQHVAVKPMETGMELNQLVKVGSEVFS